MREGIRRLVFVLSAVALLTVGMAGTALASTARPLHQTPKGPHSIYAVGLPYTFTIDFISGGSSGVNTPSFYTNSTGKICIDPNLYVKTNASAGSQYNDNRYKALMYHNETFGDQHVGTDKNFNSDTDNGSSDKQCWTGLIHNDDYHVNIRKTVFVEGQTLAGSGVISYT